MLNASALGVWQLLVVAAGGNAYALVAYGGQAAVMREMGRRVRLAREHASLTQSALAAKLGVTQARVSRAESGSVSLSSAFFARVHKACKLPPDWVP
jgi:predicted transcriptional regulator